MPAAVESSVGILASVWLPWPHHDAIPTLILPYCIALIWAATTLELAPL